MSDAWLKNLPRRPNATTHPIGARLWDWRAHCLGVHGAPFYGIKHNVKRWHAENHPECGGIER